jgi:hypothetical protein
MSKRTYPPDYCKRETLAYRLDVAPAVIDQYVKRGLLPEPVQFGEAKLWRWADVEARLASGPVTDDAPPVDPYELGIRGNGVKGEVATLRGARS